MKIIFENADIANATGSELQKLFEVMANIAKKQEEKPTMTAEIPVVETKVEEPVEVKAEPEAKVEEPKQEEKPRRGRPKKEEAKKEKVEEKAEEPAEEEPVEEKAEPEATPEVSRTDVINLGKKLVKGGHGKEVNKLMKGTYGVSKFSDITDEQLPDVYKALKEIEDAA